MTEPEALWKHIRAGDRRAFEAFYYANAPRILQFLCRMTGNRNASEDITQEVFLQLWSHPNGFDPARGSLVGYVFGIARNLGAEWWRRRRTLYDQNLSYASDVDAKSGDALSGIALHDAFSQLKVDDRCLLWLREIEGHSYAELAMIFNVPIGTIRSRLFSAREELRRLWRTD
jgi:RNA polymerase sigma-70 factor (ECF subfamily)